jgi:hypothetical protein
VDPLLSLGSLSTDIKHAICECTGFEDRLADASCS